MAVLLCVTAFGCGYTTATTSLSDEYRTIAVPAFKNLSFEQELQIRVTNQLIREIEADGRLRVVDDLTSADLILSGTITGFEAHAISFTGEDEIAQFKITIIADARIEDARKKEVVWQQSGLTGTDFYQTAGGRTRYTALDEATENLVETIIYESFDSFW
jgi:curli biogenesis system outer membrane secretion channel CsgG